MSNFEFVQIDPEFSLMRPSHPFFLDHVHRKCSTCFHLHPSTTFPFRISIISVHFPLLFLVSLTVVSQDYWKAEGVQDGLNSLTVGDLALSTHQTSVSF